MVRRPWPDEVLRYCSVAAHVHSSALPNPACVGTQTRDEIVTLAQDLGLEGVVFNDHTADPAKPGLLDTGDIANLRHRLFLAEHARLWQQPNRGLLVQPGVEANILPGGQLDIDTHQGHLGFVIASQHGGLGDSEKDPAAIEQRLIAACYNSRVGALGHPTRYNDDAMGVNWPRICDVAALTGTALELNFNLWYRHGPGQTPQHSWDITTWRWYWRQHHFWLNWLQIVARSGASVLVGLDAHSADMWPGVGTYEYSLHTRGRLTEFVRLIARCGIPPHRVINSSAGRWELHHSQHKLARIGTL